MAKGSLQVCVASQAVADRFGMIVILLFLTRMYRIWFLDPLPSPKQNKLHSNVAKRTYHHTCTGGRASVLRGGRAEAVQRGVDARWKCRAFLDLQCCGIWATCSRTWQHLDRDSTVRYGWTECFAWRGAEFDFNNEMIRVALPAMVCKTSQGQGRAWERDRRTTPACT
eukprot:4783048-Amphidinium_carterae.1